MENKTEDTVKVLLRKRIKVAHCWKIYFSKKGFIVENGKAGLNI